MKTQLKKGCMHKKKSLRNILYHLQCHPKRRCPFKSIGSNTLRRVSYFKIVLGVQSGYLRSVTASWTALKHHSSEWDEWNETSVEYLLFWIRIRRLRGFCQTSSSWASNCKSIEWVVPAILNTSQNLSPLSLWILWTCDHSGCLCHIVDYSNDTYGL